MSGNCSIPPREKESKKDVQSVQGKRGRNVRNGFSPAFVAPACQIERKNTKRL